MHIKKLILIVLSLSTICFSFETDTSRIKISGWGYLTAGRVESSDFENKPSAVLDYKFEKQWLIDFDAGLKAVATFGQFGKARFHLGVTTAYLLLYYDNDNAEYLKRKFVPYLIDAAIENAFVRGNNTFFGEFGYFPVKYNPQATNLGEYLFRSGTYTPYVNSGFELADKEKLVGFHGSVKHKVAESSNLKADLYFTNDMRDFPVHDFSLAYILSANTKLIQMAAGVQHAHLFVVDKNLTTPANDSLFERGTTKRKNVIMIDSTEKDGVVTYDTTLATFRGTKAMGRFTLDPKALFNASIFGDADLKVYAELAFLGIKNYPIWYTKPLERMPIMFGFNVPTFKVLDILSCEFEYYSSPYVNTAENAWRFRSPLPVTGFDGMSIYKDVVPKHDDDWRWSIYASKKLGRIKLSAQVASDHTLKTTYVPGMPTSAKYTEICTTSKNWYWMTRIMFNF